MKRLGRLIALLAARLLPALIAALIALIRQGRILLLPLLLLLRQLLELLQLLKLLHCRLHRVSLEGQQATELASCAPDGATQTRLPEHATNGTSQRLADLAKQIAEKALRGELLLLRLLLLCLLLRLLLRY
jgi:hypothetical protein